MSRTFVFIVRLGAIEFQQGPIQPLALSNETLMLVMKRAQAARYVFELVLRGAAANSARDIPPRTLQFNLSASASTFIPELHLVVTNDAFDQLVPRNHPFPGKLQLGSLLGGDL